MIGNEENFLCGNGDGHLALNGDVTDDMLKEESKCLCSVFQLNHFERGTT